MRDLKSVFDPADRIDMDSLIEDARAYENRKKIKEWNAAERPEEQYGLLHLFLSHFITDEMHEVFPEIAESFLENEPYLRSPEMSGLFEDLYYPVRMESRMEDPFVFPILEMMVLCAQNGSGYSRELLLGLYKSYYRQEYNVLKRYQKLSLFDIDTFHQMEAEKCGVSKEEYDPNDEYGFEDAQIARLALMSDLLGIELDRNWNSTLAIMNETTLDKLVFWKMIKCVDQEEILQEKKIRDFAASSEKLAASLPYVDWYFIDEEVGDEEGPNQLIALCKHVIERAMDEEDVNSDLFFEDDTFDLFYSAVNALSDTCTWIDPEKDSDKMILLAVVRYLADVIAGLEKQREEELRMTLHLHYTEPVTDEIMQEAGVSSDSLRRFRDAQAGEATDPQIEKILRKAKEAAKKTSVKRTSENRDRTKGTIREKSGSDGKDPMSAGPYEEQLAEKNRQIAELKGKLRQQHTLLEESRKREISLKTHMDEWKRDQTELIRLRDFVHNLEEENADENAADDTRSYEDMISVLKTRKIMIVGGHENWIKKIRRIFPDWIYIGARSGLGIKGAVQSCDKIYFYTDICGHSLYYRFLGMAAEYKKPYAYLHGTNMDHVVRTIYGDLVERK